MKVIWNYWKKLRDSFLPCYVTFRAGEEYVLVSLKTYMPTDSADLQEAIDRLTAQMPYNRDYKEHEYLLYAKDKRALAKMCNDYCVGLAEVYEFYHPILKGWLTQNYNTATTLMLKLL